MPAGLAGDGPDFPDLSEVDVDGILGTMKMRVLSTVLAPPAQAMNA